MAADCRLGTLFAIAGGDGDADHGLGGVAHVDGFARGLHRAAGRGNLGADGEAQALAAFGLDLSAEGEAAALGAAGGIPQAGEENAEVERAGARRRQPDQDHLRGFRSQDLARVADAAGGELGGGDGGVEIERAAVVRRFGDAGHLDPKVAGGLVGLDALGAAHHGLGGEFGGFEFLAGEEQFADARQGVERLRVHGVAGEAFPKRILVELKAFVLHAAEDHRAEPSVADGEGFVPAAGRLAVPQGERRAGALRGAGKFRGPLELGDFRALPGP